VIPVKVDPPSKKDLLGIRILVLLGLIAFVTFIYWFFSNSLKGNAFLYWLLTGAMIYKLSRMLHEWYHYVGVSVPERPVLKRDYTVDMLTTYCPGEPKSMIKETLTAMVAITYPHTTYLCDEGNDPELKKFCEDLGVIHVTREVKKNAKAGNINNALQQATGEITVILDPDHVPVPEFLDRVLPYFQDEKIGYVQTVQAYYNKRESLIALGAAEQTYHFYGPMMMSMGNYGTCQAIGANCAFRRSALDSIGGHAPGLAEDMHTAMQLHAKGWTSIYVPEILTRGLVPGTLPAYYSQQLKWSRGTFELLFEVFPKLFKNLSWRQKIHYFTVPLYYLAGLITLIDIVVPIVALVTSEVAWKVNLAKFSLYFLPLFFMSLLIRQYAQRWLLEYHERGFHAIGGLLRIGTWWIYLVGFVYSIIRVKVPYIPTPKDDKPRNNFKLALPNIIAALLSLGAVYYGLSVDKSPYTYFMAGFAIMNFLLLSFIVVISQEKWIANIYNNYYERVLNLRLAYGYSRQWLNKFLRKWAVAFAMLGLVAILGYTFSTPKPNLDFLKPPLMKNTGGFYTGIFIPKADEENNINYVQDIEKKINNNFSIVSIYEPWGPESIEQFPDSLLRAIHSHGGMPMITWEPWATTFPEFKDHPDLKWDRKVCKAIHEGLFDHYIRSFATKIREYKHPVFLRFAHEPDNLAYPWSPKGGNTPGEFIAAWRHVVDLFEASGTSNVTWVWNPLYPNAVNTYFPGGRYVDWIGLTCLNYGTASIDGQWRTFEEIYLPYRKDILNLYRPIMLAEFGSTPYGGNQDQWLADAMNKIRNKYSEINAAVIFNSDRDKNWITDWRPEKGAEYIDWTIDDNSNSIGVLKDNLSKAPFSKKPLLANIDPYKHTVVADKTNRKSPIVGKAGHYQLMVDGKPFYIQGIAYNPGHDWRDGDFPLTRKQIKEDFERIKEMGGNCIRRYNPTNYDFNLLNEADHKGLKVLYGFWFDPEVDYYKDTAKVNKYIRDAETALIKYKDHPCILGWSVGNETWGLLKHRFSKPYLTQVRISYVQMVERIAERIHELDPNRPVFSSMEHEETQLAGEVACFKDWAPSIDVIGVNSYYLEQISKLDTVFTSMDSTRPYLVSEFGPRGYWKPEYSMMKDSMVFEDSDGEKAKFYALQWNQFIGKNKGNNVGGVAYCWRDRFEGSTVWFGITDIKNRLKPAYYSLKSTWKDHKPFEDPLSVYIISPAQQIIPGRKYKFVAYSSKPVPDTYTYTWELCREDYLDFVDGVQPVGNGKEVIINLPKQSSHYRLYLHICDPEGNVYSASKPLHAYIKN
jgi:hypothetical protein